MQPLPAHTCYYSLDSFLPVPLEISAEFIFSLAYIVFTIGSEPLYGIGYT